MPEVPCREPEHSDNTARKRKREDVDEFSAKKKSRWGVLISQGELSTRVNKCAFIQIVPGCYNLAAVHLYWRTVISKW